MNWSSSQEASWGVVGPGATVIATIADTPDHAAIYTHAVGATLFDGSKSPGLRVHIPGGDATFSGLTPDGLKLFDAAIKFAANLSAAQPTIGIARAGAGATITYTGVLQSTDALGGAWADVSGAEPVQHRFAGRYDEVLPQPVNVGHDRLIVGPYVEAGGWLPACLFSFRDRARARLG